jgi:ABC-2 type transport system ATP-binding protein
MAVAVAESLTKRYGSLTAVDGLSFALDAGTVTGFLGPNGAGKTTTLRMLLGLARPTSGRALVFDRPYAELERPALRVGAVLEATDFHPGRSGRNHLRTLAHATGAPDSRVDEVLKLVELDNAKNRRVKPANGLDPEGVRWLRDFLRSFAAGGRTVLVSSHVLAEVAQTVDRVLIINGGRLVVESTLGQLTARVGGSVRVRSPQAHALREALAREGVDATETEGVLFVHGTTSKRVGEVAAASGVVLHELVNDASSLEEVFLELTADREIK